MNAVDPIVQRIDKLLEMPFWLSTLETGEQYQRYEDDTPLGYLAVLFGGDGDGYITVFHEQDPNDRHMSMRFRMPMIGGGQSPRVRNALLILARAIQLDNEDKPQQRG